MTATTLERHSPLPKDQHLALIKQALAATLRARYELDCRQDAAAKAKGYPIPETPPMSCSDLLAINPIQLGLEATARRPEHKALRKQLKDLGKQLFRLMGSTNAMRDVAEELANEKGRGGFQYQAGILDHAWDGVGEGNDHWWC